MEHRELQDISGHQAEAIPIFFVWGRSASFTRSRWWIKADEPVFNRLFEPEERMIEVKAISFEATETNSSVTSVPQPSSHYVGVLVLGILGIGLALKRQRGTM
ncbi:hypothetical protein [Oscillatoria acuminata]|uniref:Uncharacterized protein n=1 Tax=Oscillatoria acuminata PCC 6304 TaxID=56110 RepID=K9TK75_9CYAN|nr:hypothetical protein [Oscillatoria acuminata]AFY82419.1 hypothetical protein Oscil6304_2817 [Oscillatoria acuminata PCC 6304]